MPSITFTALASTDALTATAHGLLTGDGPVAVRTIGGTLPGATPALDPDADYWAIRVDADTLKIATSQALALAGTAIDLTSDSTGVCRIEYGIPYRRATTYAPPPAPGVPGSQIRSADLNALQDSARSEFEKKRTISLQSGSGYYTVGRWQLGADGAYMEAITGAGSLYVPFPCHAGQIITGASFWFSGDGVNTMTASIRSTAGPGGVGGFASLAIAAAASSWAEYSILFSPYEVAPSEAIGLQFQSSAAGGPGPPLMSVGTITMTVMR